VNRRDFFYARRRRGPPGGRKGRPHNQEKARQRTRCLAWNWLRGTKNRSRTRTADHRFRITILCSARDGDICWMTC